jgi:predicted phosphoribosyltransferase
VIAVPTAAADSCEMLEPMVDELIALVRPAYFRAVGQWYDDFAQTTDDEVKQLLEKARARRISEA